MNYVAICFISSIALLLLYTIFRLIIAIQGNFHSASELRNQFSQRIHLLPMYKMLRLRGIALNKLLHQLPISDIETGIRNCESCDKDKLCQETLKNKSGQNLDFCPNDQAFIKFQKMPEQVL